MCHCIDDHPAVRVPRHCQFSATRLWIVTKDVPNATNNSIVYEKVRVTHERREAVVRVCVRKHVPTRVRRSKAHTRETQFKPKERERQRWRRFSGSRILHTGWPGLAYGAVKMAASMLFSLSSFVVLSRLVFFPFPLDGEIR